MEKSIAIIFLKLSTPSQYRLYRCIQKVKLTIWKKITTFEHVLRILIKIIFNYTYKNRDGSYLNHLRTFTIYLLEHQN